MSPISKKSKCVVHISFINQRFKRCSFYTGKPLKSPKETAILAYSTNSKHPGERDNFKIIGTTNGEISLRILESLLILRDKPNLNKALSSFPLNIV